MEQLAQRRLSHRADSETSGEQLSLAFPGLGGRLDGLVPLGEAEPDEQLTGIVS